MKKFRKNNKGFTLVELIIVIAIIAILSAVAAPQYIKYVENSRVAKDQNNAGSIRTAIETIIVDKNSDSDANNDIPADFTVIFNASGINADDVSGENPVNLANLRAGLVEILGGSFAGESGAVVANEILKTSQNTEPVCTITFASGKFASMVWSAS